MLIVLDVAQTLIRQFKVSKNEIQNISIDLVPSKNQSQWWNKCFNKTSLWFNKKGKNLENWIKPQKNPLQLLRAMGLFTTNSKNEIRKIILLLKLMDQ